MWTNKLLPCALLCALGVTACANDKPPVAPSRAEAPPPLPQKTSAADRTPGDAVMLSEDIKTKCAMPTATQAPKFEFDSPILGGVGREPLDILATCLRTGALRDQRVQLVGRADPRGEIEYNMALGSNRAESVAVYLRSLGVATGQIGVTSRGELDAIGVDESTWAVDRRVDVVLRPPS